MSLSSICKFCPTGRSWGTVLFMEQCSPRITTPPSSAPSPVHAWGSFWGCIAFYYATCLWWVVWFVFFFFYHRFSCNKEDNAQRAFCLINENLSAFGSMFSNFFRCLLRSTKASALPFTVNFLRGSLSFPAVSFSLAFLQLSVLVPLSVPATSH